MSLFNFGLEELFTFFCVLVRFSIVFSVLPFLGDRMIPSQVKILTALSVSIALFPSLVTSGQINPDDARIWARSASGICLTVGLEVMFGLLLGFTARLIFEGISFSANLVGTFMGFATASTYDPHQESQTQIVAQVQTTLAMLLFLALDGHHLMLHASLNSYRSVGVGRAVFNGAVSERLIHLTGEVLRLGLQLSAPVAISLFAVNVVFGIVSKAIPQLNVLTLSFGVTALAGLVVMLFSMSDFHGALALLFEKMYDWMREILVLNGGR